MRIFQKIVLGARARLAREVELCVLPNEERAKVFREQTKTKKALESVWNVPRSDEICEQKKRPNPDNPLRIFYGGSLSSERLSPLVLEEVVRLHPKIELHIVGYATYQHRELLNNIESYAGKGLLKFHGPKSREKMWAIADQCETAFCLMPMSSQDLNMRTMAGASNKPFDAMARGLAVVVSDIPEWEKLYLPGDNHEGGKGFRISDTGYGIAINPERRGSIQAGLEWMLNNREKLWAMGENGRSKIKTSWNYDKIYANIVKGFFR